MSTLTHAEIMQALLDGKIVATSHNIFLRLEPRSGMLQSMAWPHDPDWTNRTLLFNEGTRRNPDVYARIVDAGDLALMAHRVIASIVSGGEEDD